MNLLVRLALLLSIVVFAHACAGEEGPQGPSGADGDQGPQGVPGTSAAVTSAVDHFTSLPGASITTIPESSLSPVPAGATTRRVLLLSAVLRANTDVSSSVMGVYSGYINPVPAGEAHAVTIWDPANGEFTGSGLEVLHVDVVSYFSN